MPYRIMYNREPIGTSELEFRDAAMAVAFGVFRPSLLYERIRPVFLLFTDAQAVSGHAADQQKLAQYYAERDALKLVLERDDGTKVETGHIHIVDWGLDSDADLEIEAHITDAGFWGTDQNNSS